MSGQEKSKIEILKATVNRGGEEQDRDPEGHGGRQEHTYFSSFNMSGEVKSKTEILKATLNRGGEEKDRDPDGHGGRQ